MSKEQFDTNSLYSKVDRLHRILTSRASHLFISYDLNLNRTSKSGTTLELDGTTEFDDNFHLLAALRRHKFSFCYDLSKLLSFHGQPKVNVAPEVNLTANNALIRLPVQQSLCNR